MGYPRKNPLSRTLGSGLGRILIWCAFQISGSPIAEAPTCEAVIVVWCECMVAVDRADVSPAGAITIGRLEKLVLLKMRTDIRLTSGSQVYATKICNAVGAVKVFVPLGCGCLNFPLPFEGDGITFHAKERA